MKFHLLCLMASALLVFFVAAPAGARDEPWHRSDDRHADFAVWLEDVEAYVRLRTHPVRRAIICRVPFANLTVNDLAEILTKPVPRLVQAVTVLQDLGLVTQTMNKNGDQIISPANETARSRMCQWAYDWCDIDDECAPRP